MELVSGNLLLQEVICPSIQAWSIWLQKERVLVSFICFNIGNEMLNARLV
jgi:hypothetical protein